MMMSLEKGREDGGLHRYESVRRLASLRKRPPPSTFDGRHSLLTRDIKAKEDNLFKNMNVSDLIKLIFVI
jgi:hypothetical protein